MKKLLLSTLCILVLFSAIVAAAPAIGLNTETITINQKPNKGFSSTFSVNNNGSVNLSSMAVTLTTSELSEFNVSFSPSSFDLTINTSQVITISGTIPDDVNTRLSAFSGTITVANSQASQSATLNVNALNQLNLDNVKIVVDGKSKSVDQGDTVRDVLPGSKIVVKGDIENSYSDDEDIEIQDVEITVTIRDVDDDDDLEETDDVGDISADDEESFRVEFEIPEDVDEDNYKVVFEVEGDDENNARHFFELEDVEIEVEKDKHDIVIRKASVSPSRVTCSRTIGVNVGLKNQGQEDEDEVVIRLENIELDINHEDVAIPEIEEGTGSDTEFDKTYTFKLADDIDVGTYPIAVKAYYDTDTLSSLKNVDVLIEECTKKSPPKQEEPEEKEEQTTVVIQQPKEEKKDEGKDLGIITTPITTTTEGSFFSSNTFIILLGAVIIGIIIIGVLGYVLYSMKKEE